MCVACIEYAKGTLTLNEFKAALRETTLEDAGHSEEVAKILKDYAHDAAELKKRLKQLEG